MAKTIALKFMAMFLKCSIFPFAVTLLAAIAVSSCGRRENHETDSAGTKELRDSAAAHTPLEWPERAEALKGIVALEHHMSSGNAKAFAADCSYPIERPYPLRNIADSAEMETYFPLMIDDSLKTAVRNAQFERWRPEGWRGWTLDNGKYLWWDGKLYAVSYISKAERALRRRLVEEEKKSLAPSLRAGWEPFFCLIGEDNGTIYRIDVESHRADRADGQSDSETEFTSQAEADPEEDSPRFRMLVYPRDTSLHELPADSLRGVMIVEGSAGSRILSFTSSDGRTAEFDMDSTVSDDTETPQLIVVEHGDTAVHAVNRIYWRDYIALPR